MKAEHLAKNFQQTDKPVKEKNGTLWQKQVNMEKKGRIFFRVIQTPETPSYIPVQPADTGPSIPPLRITLSHLGMEK